MPPRSTAIGVRRRISPMSPIPVVSRVETRALMAESGEAEFVFGLDPASVSRLGMLDTVEVMSVDIPRTLLIKVNAGQSALSEPDGPSRTEHVY